MTTHDLSACCGAIVRVINFDESTYYLECSECGKPCSSTRLKVSVGTTNQEHDLPVKPATTPVSAFRASADNRSSQKLTEASHATNQQSGEPISPPGEKHKTGTPEVMLAAEPPTDKGNTHLLSNCCAADFDPFGYEKGEGIYQERCLNCGKLCELIVTYDKEWESEIRRIMGDVLYEGAGTDFTAENIIDLIRNAMTKPNPTKGNTPKIKCLCDCHFGFTKSKHDEEDCICEMEEVNIQPPSPKGKGEYEPCA